ncbi:MAG TPA: hypothetical protein VGA85_04770 [Dehalococcoidales bacterium]
MPQRLMVTHIVGVNCINHCFFRVEPNYQLREHHYRSTFSANRAGDIYQQYIRVDTWDCLPLKGKGKLDDDSVWWHSKSSLQT